MAEKFIPRLNAPSTSNRYYYADNVYYQSGYGLPNCTCYSWGRWFELLGTKPRLSLRNAENWWAHDDGYARGQTPKLGAVVCWRKGQAGNASDGAGHVAIVERVNDDGSYLVGESGASWTTKIFQTRTIPASNYYASAYTFQGFIYPPVEFIHEDDWVEEVDKGDVTSANRYLSEEEMQLNARYFYQEMSKRGWTLNAVAGMLGNMETESTINAGIWQSLDSGNLSGGYGLVQWTPASKYINWCVANDLEQSDMDSAIARLEWELANGEQYYATGDYPESFEQFKTSTKSPEYLANAFLANYERPYEEDQPNRATQARKWYDYLLPFANGGGGGGSGSNDRPTYTPRKTKGLPLWLMIETARRR